MDLKQMTFRIVDILSFPVACLTGIHMWLLRRYGLPNFPLSRMALMKIGVMPIRRHFYEPLFHADDLPRPLASPRSLPGIDFNESGEVDLLSRFAFQSEIEALCLSPEPRKFWGRALTPDNPTFRHGDIDFYYSLIRLLQPKRIVEIGAGYSTMVALCALEKNATKDSVLTAIEPFPWFSDDRVKMIGEKVEAVDPQVFAELEENDILFIDSSHMIRPQGDVLFEILEILPMLAPGVVIHIHDVFTPRDYPSEWVLDSLTLWNEQYLIEAFLSCNTEFEIIGALNWLQMHHPKLLEEKCPTLRRCPDARPHSFWIRKL